MKTLSRTFRFVVLGVIVMVVVVSCCVFPTIPDPRITLYSIDIGYGGNQYVEWKDGGTGFKQALQQVRGRKGGDYCICIIIEPGRKPDQYPGSKCPEDYTTCPSPNSSPGNIRTVKVTKSKVADNTANGQSAVNDPNAFYRVRSPVPGDIKKVLDELKK